MGLQANIGGRIPLSDIYVLHAGETQPTALTDTPTFLDSGPAFSWDGSQIAFESTPADSPIALWVMGLDGSGAHALSGAFARSPSWAPDGRRIVAVQEGVDGGTGLAIIDAVAGDLRPLAADAGVEDSPSWSADGRQIVFSLLPPGANDQDIYSVNPDGTGLRRLTTDPAYEYAPRWSRDGRHIAFVRGGDIWVMDPDGSHQRQVTSGLRADAPDWSPDGSRIAFIVGGGPVDPDLSNIDPSRRAIWFVGADGSGLSRLDLPFDVIASPVWQP
jgi:Tol biopolymer transport system component